MVNSITQKGLELSADEAFALLQLALTSPQKLDAESERAIHKLADFCRRSNHDQAGSSLPQLEAAG